MAIKNKIGWGAGNNTRGWGNSSNQIGWGTVKSNGGETNITTGNPTPKTKLNAIQKIVAYLFGKRDS